MVVTLFDLDHTLLPLDTNQAWIGFLCDTGALQASVYRPQSEAMKVRYQAGGADPDVAFCEFFIGTLALFAPTQRAQLRQRFMTEVVLPAITPAARDLVERHRLAGDVLAIITATNRYITTPVAAAFGIEHLIATECEMLEGRLTGKVIGVPSMRSGKVSRFSDWLAREPLAGLSDRKSITELRFYSDSINDQALLEQVDVPIAVDPDPPLHQLAEARGWQIIELNQTRRR